MTEASIPGLPAAAAALKAMQAAGTAAPYDTGSGAPLVSVALVTNRADFAEDAMANFQRQTYPHRELVVVVNADTALLEQWHALAEGRPEIRI